MTSFAIVLVIVAAFIHATWNFLAKRAGGGTAFVWLFATLSAIIYAPITIALIVIQRPHIGFPEFLFILGSAILHLMYFLLLQRGYNTGDLSLVYPLARGTGPMLSTVSAIVFFGERPTPIALGGAILIAICVFVLSGDIRKLQKMGTGSTVIYGLLTGTIIAAYTLWDKRAVSTLLIPPLLLDYCSTLGRVALLAPFALRSWDKVCTEWSTHRLEAIGVAFLNPLSYILVLTALVFTPVSYIAPSREISVLIGAFMGTHLLRESDAPRRLFAAAGMMLGMIAIAID
ncbi:MAG: DMT family transporter [Nostoc sp.]|uniref:DMT family transporter n=1 Tax=Nostoc sp. TaxID=1180 RepID=UPI002FFCA6E9